MNSAWVRHFHRTPDSALRLFCFPHAGGSATYFYPLSQLLAPDVQVLALQYPGRQDRGGEKCVEDLLVLAHAIFREIRRETDREFAFFGHSMGSVLAFEVARLLQAHAGVAPRWLVASGYPAPSRLRNGTVHLRDDDGLLRELRELGGIDERWLSDADLMAGILPPLRADYRAIETHRRTAGQLRGVPVTAVAGDADPHTTADEARAWSTATTGPFSLHVVPGGHFYLDDAFPEVAGLIRAAQGQAVAPGA